MADGENSPPHKLLGKIADEEENLSSNEDLELGEESLHSSEGEGEGASSTETYETELSERSTSISDYLSSPEEDKEADEANKDSEKGEYKGCTKIHRDVFVERIPDSLEIVHGITAREEDRSGLKASLKVTEVYTWKEKLLCVRQKGIFIHCDYKDEEQGVTHLHELTDLVNGFYSKRQQQSPPEQEDEPVYYEPDVAMNIIAGEDYEKEQDELALYNIVGKDSAEQGQGKKESDKENSDSENTRQTTQGLPEDYKSCVLRRYSPDDPAATIDTAEANKQNTKENGKKSITEENGEKAVARENGSKVTTTEQEKFTGAIPKKKRYPDPDPSSK